MRGIVHAKTAEGYFAVFKRCMKGVYQHCGKQHLHRYLAEFDFRYSNRVKLGVGDTERTARAAVGINGNAAARKARREGVPVEGQGKLDLGQIGESHAEELKAAV